MKTEQENFKILRRKDVESLTGMKRTAILDRVKKGEFPKPINLGNELTIGWLESEVHDWIRSRIALRDKGAN